MRHRAGPPPNRIRTKSPSGGRRRGNSAARKEKVRGRLRPLDFAIMKGRGQGANQIPLKFVAFGDRNLAASGAASPFPFAEPRLILKPGPVPFLAWRPPCPRWSRRARPWPTATPPSSPCRAGCTNRPAASFPTASPTTCRHLEPFPVYVDRAAGGRKWDVDGHELVDYWSRPRGAAARPQPSRPWSRRCSGRWRGPRTPAPATNARSNGADWCSSLVPSAETVRFTSSGTEATLMALRLARIFTGRPKVLKFAGHFHGWHDFLIPAADPPYDGATPPGVPPEVAAADRRACRPTTPTPWSRR